MELAHSNKYGYQLELQTYQTTFPNFKYKSLQFAYVEIGTSSRAPFVPSMAQPIATTKLVNPLKGGTCLEITLICSFYKKNMFRLLLLLLNLWIVVTNL
jgi:hypothetical protein